MKGKQIHGNLNLQFQSLVFLSYPPANNQRGRFICWTTVEMHWNHKTHHREGQQNIRMSTCITYLTRKNTSHQQWVTLHPSVFSNSETELWWFSSKRWKFYWNLSPHSTSWPPKSRGEMQKDCILRSLSISACFSAHKNFRQWYTYIYIHTVPPSLWITCLLR